MNFRNYGMSFWSNEHCWSSSRAPHFVAEFSNHVPFKERHVVPVGITGWAQINGRSVLTRRPEHKIKYDIYYINHWSFLFDIKFVCERFCCFCTKESYC